MEDLKVANELRVPIHPSGLSCFSTTFEKDWRLGDTNTVGLFRPNSETTTICRPTFSQRVFVRCLLNQDLCTFKGQV